MNKHTLRNVLRWGGIGVAVVGFILARRAMSPQIFATGRVLVWTGLVMMVAGIVVRLFISDK